MTYEDLAQLGLFRGLRRKDLERFSAVARIEEYGKEELIFSQGARADKLYVVLNGVVAIRFEPSDGDPLTVTSVERGGMFGWSSALGRRTYTSSAICEQPARVVSVEGHLFRGLCENHPETGVVIIERLAEVIAGRLSSTRGYRRSVAQWSWDGVVLAAESAGTVGGGR